MVSLTPRRPTKRPHGERLSKSRQHVRADHLAIANCTAGECQIRQRRQLVSIYNVRGQGTAKETRIFEGARSAVAAASASSQCSANLRRSPSDIHEWAAIACVFGRVLIPKNTSESFR